MSLAVEEGVCLVAAFQIVLLVARLTAVDVAGNELVVAEDEFVVEEGVFVVDVQKAAVEDYFECFLFPEILLKNVRLIVLYDLNIENIF